MTKNNPRVAFIDQNRVDCEFGFCSKAAYSSTGNCPRDDNFTELRLLSNVVLLTKTKKQPQFISVLFLRL